MESQKRFGPAFFLSLVIKIASLTETNKQTEFTLLRFSSSIPCLYDLPVPDIMKTMTRCNTTCQINEKRSLVRFYHSTFGYTWKNSSHWLSKSVHHCEWFGVLCCKRTRHVIAISMPRNSLEGNVANSLLELKVLLGICVGSNGFGGNLFSIFWGLSTHILRIDFAYTNVEGNFHLSGITRFKHLKKIQLSGSVNVKGRLPENIGDLKELMVLSLGETNIRGDIPYSIRSLTDLCFLDLEALHLQGNLNVFQNMTKLSYMHLATNRIKGNIPSNFGSIYPRMIELHLQNNFITGEIPRSLGLAVNLTQIHISGNTELHGLIPREIGRLRKLKVFSTSETRVMRFESGFKFESNNIGLFNMKNMKFFHCEMDVLLDILSASSDSLIQLNVENSNINGSLHESVFHFKKLTTLDVGKNFLSGKLPDPKENIEFLATIDASYNDFRGSLPSAFTKLQLLQKLDLQGNPKLKGDIVPEFLKADFTQLIDQGEQKYFLCPQIHFLHNSGILQLTPDYYGKKYCVCKVGYYGLGGNCFRCLSNANCPGESTFKIGRNSSNTYLAENETTKTLMYMQRQYWPLPSPDNVQLFYRCSYQFDICNHNGSCSCHLASTGFNNSQFTTKCDRNCLCRTGHKGRFCSQCHKGYYMNGKLCYKCPNVKGKLNNVGSISGFSFLCIVLVSITFVISLKSIRVAVVLIAVELGVILALFMTGTIPQWLLIFFVMLNILGFGSYAKHCRGIFKIVTFYLQVLASLLSSKRVWPIGIHKVEVYLNSAFNLRLSALACYLPTLFNITWQHGILFSLPLAVGVILFAGYLLYRAISKYSGRQDVNVKWNFLRLLLVFLDFSYFPISKSALQIVSPCTRVYTNTTVISYMSSYVWIDCEGQTYYALLAMAVVAIIVYVVGIPYVLYSSLLIKYKRRIQQEDEDLSKWLGCLYLPYRKSCNTYMEIIVISKRLFIAILLAVVSSEESIQTILIVLILLLSFGVDSCMQPFLSYANVPRTLRQKYPKLFAFGIENALSCLTDSVLIVCLVFSQSATTFKAGSGFFTVLVLNVILILLFAISFITVLLMNNRAKHAEEDPLLRHG